VLTFRLYMLQRITALIMAPLVIGHIAVMIVAVQGGLSAAEILGRTQGSLWWAIFYGTFALAVSIHAAIGLRTIAFEMAALKDGALDFLSWAVFVLFAALGLGAVFAVTA